MVRRSTWFLLLLLAALILLMVFLNRRKQAQAVEATPTAATVTFLFGGEQGAATDIRIEAATGESVRIVRDASGQWLVKEPIEGLASQGLAQAAADQVGAMEQLGIVEIGQNGAAVFGLEVPAHTLTIAFSEGARHSMAVGSKTETESGYYVRLDDEATARIITFSSIDSLLNLLLSPPYEQTPTPSPAPSSETPALTETPAPAP